MLGPSSEFSICFIEPTMGRCRGVGPLQIDTIDEPWSTLVFCENRENTVKMAKLLRFEHAKRGMLGPSSEFSSCFIEPTMGRCRGVGPLQIDTIDEPRSTLVFAKIAKTPSKWPNCYDLNMLKGVCSVLTLNFRVISLNRLWGVVGECVPYKLTPLTSPGKP